MEIEFSHFMFRIQILVFTQRGEGEIIILNGNIKISITDLCPHFQGSKNIHSYRYELTCLGCESQDYEVETRYVDDPHLKIKNPIIFSNYIEFEIY